MVASLLDNHGRTWNTNVGCLPRGIIAAGPQCCTWVTPIYTVINIVLYQADR